MQRLPGSSLWCNTQRSAKTPGAQSAKQQLSAFAAPLWCDASRNVPRRCQEPTEKMRPPSAASSEADRTYGRCTSRVASGRNGARVENPPLLVQRRGADRSADCGLHRWKTQRFPNVLAVLEPSYLRSPQCQGIAPGRLDERTLLATGGSQ